MKNLRVLLVDDEIMIREGFKRLFDWQAHDCEVVGEAADGMEALAKIDTLRPDIVIHRLTGDGPKSLLLAPLWTANKRQVLNTMQAYFKAHDIWQGKEFSL